ncbi:MAG: C25 family cysteine peptidase [Thermoanaerobaculia bacterium]
MKRIFFIFFIFFLKFALFEVFLYSFEIKLEEGRGYLRLKISLQDGEIETLLQGKEIEKFSYFLGPSEPALTTYSFYLALPEEQDFSYSIKEKEKIKKSKIPILSEDGFPVFKEYKVSSKWFPEESVKTIKSGFIRQVPFKIFQFYPLQISEKGIKINSEVELQIDYDPSTCHKIEENEVFSRIYDSIFLNEWRDKGVQILSKTEKKLRSIPSSPFTIYKISVETDGIYALDYNFLDVNTDWNLNYIDPRFIHLYNLGQEIPIYISGESDGHFDTTDVLYFYGESFKGENMEGVWQRGDFTDRNIYWLVIQETMGLRMGVRDVSPVNNYPPVQNYIHTEKFEENLLEFAFVPEQHSDHWMWKGAFRINYPPPTPPSIEIATHLINIPSISSDPSFLCTLKYEVRGISYFPQNPDHHIKLRINNQEVDEFYFEDFLFYQREINFPQSYLGYGNQTVNFSVEVQDPSILGLDTDRVATNWFEITYKRDFQAQNNSLLFNLTSGSKKVQISNFSSSALILFDITNPKSPIFCANWQFSAGTLTFEDSILTKNYYRAEVPKIPSPLIPYAENNLLNENPQYLVIVPKNWINSTVLSDYLSFRQSQGLDVKKVAVEDIYDNFSYGIFSPFGIKEFLQNLYFKSSPPVLTYILLIGDADYDYKDFKGDGNFNFIPTYMMTSTGHSDAVFNNYAYYSYENFFVNFLGQDDLPEVLLGRISSKSQAEMEATLNKIKLFETSLPDKSYLKNFLHIAGCRDGTFFESAQATNKSYVETPYSVEDMYLRLPPYNPTGNCNYPNYDINGNGKKDIVDRFNSGEGIINYIGHGSFIIWDDKGALQNWGSNDLQGLTNIEKPSVVLNSNCYTASFYHSSLTTTILEDLVNRSTGAASAFGPGTFMQIFQLTFITDPFYSAFFSPSKERNLGALYFQSFAKVEAMGDSRLAKGIVHLGDPATIFPAPTPGQPLNISISNPSCRVVQISYNPPDSGTYTYNIYRSTEPNSNYTKISSNFSGTTFQDTDLIYGETYYYRIAAVDGEGFEGRWSQPQSIYVEPCPPEVPQNFQCQDIGWGGRIKYSWAQLEEPEVINYRIYYGFSSESYPYFANAGNVSSYEIGGFTDGTPVFAKISAFNYFNLESNKSSEISCTPTHTNGWKAPEMVYPIKLTRDGSNPVIDFYLPSKNIWGDPISPSDIDFCTIYRSQNPNFVPNRSSSSPDKIGLVYPSSCKETRCRFKDTNSPQNAYYYVTCQTPQKEESSISINPPLYIANLNINYGLGEEIYLYWQPVLKKIDGTPANIQYYEIYKSTTPNFLPDLKDKANRVGISYTTEFTDFGGIGYYYKVVAVDTNGNGGPY